MKRLIWDIETSPNLVLSWSVGHKVRIDYDNIVKERAVICICYKWHGEKQVHHLTWDENQCDKAMLAEFGRVAAEADELVAHNGDHFDLPWFKARCVHHGLPVLPKYVTVDTLQWARRYFYFNSNRLNYLGQFLGLGSKIKTEFGLWKKVIAGDAKALADMVRYAKRDVVLLEQVYDKLAAAMPHKTHQGVLAGREAWTCPETGSRDVRCNKTVVLASGVKRYEMQCKASGRSWRINSKDYEAYKEYKGVK